MASLRSRLTRWLRPALAAPERAALPAESPPEPGLPLSYELRKASPQTAVDIFAGSWTSRLPGDLASGVEPMFSDHRPAWFDGVVPGGIRGKTVLELGPYEGYQTYLLDRLGAVEIVSVEGSNISFLKCLCLKEILGIRASFRHGHLMAELLDPGRPYDIVWASGVLYHMADPILFLECAAKVAPALYVWTHFYDRDVIAQKLDPTTRASFRPALDREVEYRGRRIRLHGRDYQLTRRQTTWSGAPEDLTWWLTLEDIHAVLDLNGFSVAAVEHVGDMAGLPVASFAALRR